MTPQEVLAQVPQQEPFRFIDKKPVRNLQHDSATITRFRIGTHRAAVFQVAQDRQPVLDDLVAFVVTDIGNQADAAGIVLVAWVIQALACRQAFR